MATRDGPARGGCGLGHRGDRRAVPAPSRSVQDDGHDSRHGPDRPRHASRPPMTTIVVIAKEPRPGWVKTRLSPPCTPESAAVIAAAALHATLAAVTASGCSERVLALDGRPGAWVPPGFTVIPQVSGDVGA